MNVLRRLSAVIVVAACYAPTPPSGAPCAAGNRCPEPLACIAGTCTEPGGATDAGPEDGSVGGDSGNAGPDAAVPCPAGYTRTSFGACHRVVTMSRAWLEAEATCELDGAHLVVVDSAVEATSLPTLSWIGVSDLVIEGVYRAVTGPVITFDYFDLGQPSGSSFSSCIHTGGNQRWRDGPCGFPFPYVCEYDGRLADPGAF